jgi:hypothetical protein
MWPCISDEVHWLNPNPMEDCSDPEKLYTFQSPGAALEHSNKHSQNVFIDCFMFLIGYILWLVQVWVAISGLPPICSPSFCSMGGVSN